MSTRYVWDKTVAATVYTARLLNEDAYESSATFLTFGKAYNLNKSTGEFSLVEPVTYHPGYNQGMDIDFVGALCHGRGAEQKTLYELCSA